LVLTAGRISPFKSTVICAKDRPWRANAVVNSAMLRTWAGGFEVARHGCTLSVRSFQGAGDPRPVRMPARRPSGQDLARHAASLAREAIEMSPPCIERFSSAEGFRRRTSTVILAATGRTPAMAAFRDLGDVRTGGRLPRHRVPMRKSFQVRRRPGTGLTAELASVPKSRANESLPAKAVADPRSCQSSRCAAGFAALTFTGSSSTGRTRDRGANSRCVGTWRSGCTP